MCRTTTVAAAVVTTKSLIFCRGGGGREAAHFQKQALDVIWSRLLFVKYKWNRGINQDLSK